MARYSRPPREEREAAMGHEQPHQLRRAPTSLEEPVQGGAALLQDTRGWT